MKIPIFFLMKRQNLYFSWKYEKLFFKIDGGGGVVADRTLTPNSTAEVDPLPQYIQSVANMCNPHQRIVKLTS